MAIWFRHESCTVGVEDGLVRAADFARLTSLLTAAGSVKRARDRLVAEGRAEIDLERASAQRQAAAEMAKATQAHEKAYQKGIEEGRAEGLAQWAEKSAQCAWTKRRDLERQAERLGEIVATAVDRIVEDMDRSGMYRKALQTVVRLLKDVPLLTLRVSEFDHGSAQAAVDTVLQSLGAEMRIEVLVDASLANGRCLFESDLGVIDAGIETQLAAVRRAAKRAAELAVAETVEAVDALEKEESGQGESPDS